MMMMIFIEISCDVYWAYALFLLLLIDLLKRFNN